MCQTSLPALQWDPEEPETDIQRTLKQRFEGSKKLAERMANLEQMRVGQGGGNAPQSAGRRKKEHPWAEEVAEKGKRFGGSLLGALGAAGPVPEEMLHVAEEVERVQAEKREMTKAYMVGMEEILVDTHPYMLRAKRVSPCAAAWS